MTHFTVYRRFSVWLAAGVIVVAAGCTPWATYPPTAQVLSVHNPVLYPLPLLMGQAPAYLHELSGIPQRLVINLPAGTTVSVHDSVQNAVSGIQFMTSAEQKAYHVKEIRIRGHQAEVDVIEPAPSGGYQLTTVSHTFGFEHGWTATGVRTWNLDIDLPVPTLTQVDAF